MLEEMTEIISVVKPRRAEFFIAKYTIVSSFSFYLSDTLVEFVYEKSDCVNHEEQS